uniref:Zinc finger, CCHC-type n=1 Tax=Tanacetum cinerariifolium TaxID=118510 RepID=A0A6L2JGZ1_TANCI|nr:zinc finger, CCHC-type [Tanacetum cinerariifolium]
MPLMKEELDQSTTPPLCKPDCGFYVNKEIGGFCSSCYKANVLKKKASFEVPKILGVNNNADNQEPVENNYQSNEVVKKRNRRHVCNKRAGLVPFSCRCGESFCRLHQMPEKHECKFNFKAAGRVVLEKHTRLCVADKLEFRQLRLVLLTEDKENYLKHPIPVAPVVPVAQPEHQTVREIYTCKEEEGQSVSSHVLKMKGYIDNMERLDQPVGQNLATVNEPHAMLKLHEITLPKKDANPALHAIRAGRVQKNQKNKPHKDAKGGHGKSKGMMSYVPNNAPFAPKPKNLPPPKKDNPAKDAICHQCCAIGHWRRNCPVYLAELMKKKKLSQGASSSGLRGSKKLQPCALSQYVGYGHRAAIEAIGTYHLELPSRLFIVLNNWSTRICRPIDRLCLYIDAEEYELGDLGEPANYKATLLDSESKKWLDAMNVEMHSLKDNDVLVLVELPPNARTVGSKWLFKKKTDIDGAIYVFKARLVAKGFTQTYEVDYEETFSHVADIRALRILIAIAAYYDYEIRKMDVKTAFLNEHLYEEVYMEQPEGFVNPKYPNHNMTNRFQQNLGEEHWTAVKNILKYLCNTKDMFMVYGGNIERELRVSCYTDARYLTDADNLKSQTGYVFLLNGGAVDWKSTKQSIFATSSTYAEYIAAFYALKEAVWICKFIFGLGIVPTVEEPISMYCENTKSIKIVKDDGVTKGARHFHAKVYYLCETIKLGDVKIEKIDTYDNLADPFIKALAFLKHSELTRNIRLLPASSCM